MLAIHEILGSKLKFGLIALAIGLVVSLTFIMSAMSEGLITGMTGAKGTLEADGLVFQGDTYLALERSRLSAEDLETIAAATSVTDSYGIGHAFVSVGSSEEPFDARAIGLSARFDQLPIVEGSGDPGPGETVIDITAKENGVEVGDTITLAPTEEELTVIGFTRDRRYIMMPVLYVDLGTWERLHVATALGRMTSETDETAPGAPDIDRITAMTAGSASIAGVELENGATLDDLAAELGPAFDVVTPDEAAMAGNGMPVMTLAVSGIQIISLVIGALVIGVFFYITTLHKTSQIAAIKALGATDGFVFRQLLIQITILVTIASAIGIALSLGAGASMPSAMAFDPQPAKWGVSLLAVYVMAYIGSLFSLRSILTIDPATALDRGEH